MIDGIKFTLDGKEANDLWNNPLLVLAGENIKKYCGLIFKKRRNAVEVSGSLHKLKNDGKHNCDDFSFLDFCYILDRVISVMLLLNPDITVFNRFEFGVNVQLPFCPQRFLDAIILYRYKNMKQPEHEKHGIRISFQDFEIKIYNKSSQSRKYALPNTLRFEVVIKRMERLRKRLIDDKDTICKTLSDLANLEVWKDLCRELLRCFDALVIFDIDVSELQKDGKISDKDAKLLFDGKDEGYWKKLSSSTRQRRYKRFTNLIDEFSTGMKAEVRKLISDKLECVTNPENGTKYTENGTKYTTFYNADNQQASKMNGTKYNVDEVVFCPNVDIVPVNVNMVVRDSVFRDSEVTESLRAEIQYSLDNGLITEAHDKMLERSGMTSFERLMILRETVSMGLPPRHTWDWVQCVQKKSLLLPDRPLSVEKIFL